MGKFFSDDVETALQYIYYDNRLRLHRGQEGFQLLAEASGRGDGDADCIMARCLSGYQYVWPGHHFPEDDRQAVKLLHRSIERGSALGLLVAKRSGVLTPVWQKKSPLTLKEAFQQILEKAAGGDAFCQFTVGNTYFWWDFLAIEGRNRNDFPTQEAFCSYMTENITKCEDWFWRAFKGGMYLAGNNLRHYYENGDDGYVAPQPEKAAEIYPLGAEMGYPPHQIFYANDLEAAGEKEKAHYWRLQAAEGGQPGLWYRIGCSYYTGDGIERDYQKACECFARAIEEENNAYAYNGMGIALFHGRGVPQDRAKAFEYFSHAMRLQKGDVFNYPYMANCYLDGMGTAPDFQQAYRMAWETKDEPRSLYVLGRIYCEGLGMPQDIAMGVEFLDRSGLPEAMEERKHYKKTLFGRWKRVN
ncbi:MAG TPA: sel1 repeat family protein [Candidatus Lachnoclostridium pullistercoris]|uniref:Sel1 repeat family protein n=1 Tax=Candidatus Lachnoclostridium pullistercoris TaxID=2838632 RepID=A0A9D2PEP6_9FIRM|nr:sel1 repeat family protein [Candidatus Lachnoclostridium pullistercoris]